MIKFFPERILHLHKILEMPEFNMSEMNCGIPEDIIKNNLNK